MNFWERRKAKRLEELKKLTATTEATETFVRLLNSAETLSKENRKKLGEELEKRFKISAGYALERAFLEKLMTPQEWKNIRETYGLQPIDMTAVLEAVFSRKDKDFPAENFVVVTESGSKLDLARNFIENRFGVLIRSLEEATELVKEEIRQKELK